MGRAENIALNMKMSAIKNPKVFSGLYFWLLRLVSGRPELPSKKPPGGGYVGSVTGQLLPFTTPDKQAIKNPPVK